MESAKDPAKALVPLSFELGEAFQFDWSEEGLLVGGVFYKLQVAHLKLCASRAFWLVPATGAWPQTYWGTDRHRRGAASANKHSQMLQRSHWFRAIWRTGP